MALRVLASKAPNVVTLCAASVALKCELATLIVGLDASESLAEVTQGVIEHGEGPEMKSEIGVVL